MKLSLEQSSKRIVLLKQKRDEQGLTTTEKDALITLQEARLDFLEEQFRLARHKLFASNSEVQPKHDDLFNEVEEIAALELEQANSEQTDDEQAPAQEKKKRTRHTKPFAAHIMREVIIHDVDEADKVCEYCQGQMHVMGKDVTEKCVFEPETTKIEEHHRLKYACR
ncbi:IS66 family transposase zinc-finger binding domain-containing protein [Agaribacter flavus]|uniref:IS66 family transposase zinc-finger binding domain-containing protein n=1 Tax=Agaribacter flavus TaxID=1902781 RepID=A0ABV7FM16_9ALTE